MNIYIYIEREREGGRDIQIDLQLEGRVRPADLRVVALQDLDLVVPSV